MFSRAHPELGQEALHGGEDRVVTAAGAPAHLLVGLEVLAARSAAFGTGTGCARPDGCRQPAASGTSWHALVITAARSRPDDAGQLGRPERQAADLVVADRRRPGTGPQQQRQLARGSSPGPPPCRSARSTSPRLAGNGLRWRRWACATVAARLADPPAGRADRAVRRAPAEHQHPRVAGRVVDLERRESVAMPSILACAQPDHQVVVGRVVGDVAGAVGLLDAADPVLQARRAGDGPRPGQRLAGRAGRAGRLSPSPVPLGSVAKSTLQVGQRRRRPGAATARSRWRGSRRTAGSTGVRYVMRDPGRLDRGVEAVGRRARRDDRHRRLAVAAEHRLQQVGLLGLGRQAGRRAAALDVDDDQRQLER